MPMKAYSCGYKAVNFSNNCSQLLYITATGMCQCHAVPTRRLYIPEPMHMT